MMHGTYNIKSGLDVSGSGKGQVAGCCEYDNELLVPSSAGNFWNDRGTLSFLTLILLKWTIWRAPTNASKWRMGFNSAFKGLRRILVMELV